MFNESREEKVIKAVVITVTVLIITLIFVGVFSSCLSDATGHSHDVAQKQADAFTRAAGINAKAICANSDTDHNGYISCPYATPDGPDQT